MASIQKSTYLSKANGFTLVELIVVISIIAILATVATMAFTQMHRKSLAEAEIRTLASDINDLRIKAMTTKRPYGITLNEKNYVLSVYASSTGIYSSPTQLTPLTGGVRNVIYPLTKAAGTAYNNELYEIDERGSITRKLVGGTLSGSLGFTVYLGGDGTSGAVDCVKVSVLRTNIGKNTAGVCNEK